MCQARTQEMEQKTTIETCNYVLTMLDGIEYQRILSMVERHFLYILKKYIMKLLDAKRIYWKSRFQRRDIEVGDGKSKKIHDVATISYRKNDITSVSDD